MRFMRNSERIQRCIGVIYLHWRLKFHKLKTLNVLTDKNLEDLDRRIVEATGPANILSYLGNNGFAVFIRTFFYVF